MTKSRNDLLRAVGEARAAGGTALYDSMVMGLYQFRAIPGRKALVVLTDGKDNHSWTDHDTLRRYARTAGIPIFVIGLDLSLFDMSLKSKLKELSADTGAEAFFIGKATELEAIYKTIETELRSQYFMSYLTESKKPEEQFRTIEVKLKRPGLRAKTIRGYFP
jgi:VWFA-related protein